MRLDDLVDAYLTHLRVERALAENTCLAYGRDLAKLMAHCQDEGVEAAEDLSPESISRWLRGLSRGGSSARSSARHLSSLRGFMRFLIREGAISDDPTSTAVAPKLPRRLPKPLTEEEILRLLAAPDLADPRGLRDRTMLCFAYSAGLRASEIVGLRLGEIDRQRGVVAPEGKGGKRRLVPLGEVALELLDQYLEVRGDVPGAARSELVFPSPRAKQLSRQTFWRIVKRAALRAQLSDRVHPHQLRHSFATHLLTGGADLRSVQSLLGHASVITTEIYTEVTRERVQEIHRKAHPRG